MQRYTATVNDGLGYSRTVRTDYSPARKETVTHSTGIGGTYVRREVEATAPPIPAPAPIPNYTRTYTSATAITPGRVVETHVHSPVRVATTHVAHSPGSVTETRMDMGPIIETSAITMSPPRPMGSMLRMTSSPMRKPVTTTRTHFEPGFTMTEELPTNPFAPPIPLPGETIAVTHAVGREGIHTRTMDGLGGYTETVANRKSPVRTYTTTIYEEGEIPRTYTTTFKDPLGPPVVGIQTVNSARFAGSHTFISSEEPIHPAPVTHHAATTVHHGGLERAETRVQTGPLGHQEHNIRTGPLGHQERNVRTGPFGHQERNVRSGPFGHQERTIQSGPLGHSQRTIDSSAFGHHESNVQSTPYGHHQSNIHSTPYGHHESSVHSTPFGHEERRVDANAFGREETRIQQNGMGRVKTTLTNSPGRVDHAIATSQRIAEAPVMTYY